MNKVNTYYPVWYRTYSHITNGKYETYEDVIEKRVLPHLDELADIPIDVLHMMHWMMLRKMVMPSGRFLWTSGREWSKNPYNFGGMYNCVSVEFDELSVFGLLMDMAMMGSGTGAVLTDENLAKLPTVKRRVNVIIEQGKPGFGQRESIEHTDFYYIELNDFALVVGDSRKGWVDAYQKIIDLAHTEGETINVIVDMRHVRPSGAPLRGFGGVANPVRLPTTLERVGAILNGSVGRKLTPEEVCLIIDEGAAAVVAGNIRRSAGMRQFSADTPLLKENLYVQDEEGHWHVDPKREPLRMANHTRVFYHIPTLSELQDIVRMQYKTGEGAFMYAPNAEARAGKGRIGLNPCGEIIGKNFYCNLSEVHLNLIEPDDLTTQMNAFEAATLVAAPLLLHQFTDERMRNSREEDPIIGVSFTGLFDFFVNLFGRRWLDWMMKGRPDEEMSEEFKKTEASYLSFWRSQVEKTLTWFCRENGIKMPTRYTTVQPAGTKSLLTNASPGWHPPKAIHYIRRITMDRYSPVAQASLEYGYKVVPAQSAIDENGKQLVDPFDPRVSEWLIEIPVKVGWADIAEGIDISKLPANSQYELYMQVQKHYTTHNTSGTIELYENEIDTIACLISQSLISGDPYISVTLLPRLEAPFPNLPFEGVDKEEYNRRVKLVRDDVSFEDILNDYINEGVSQMLETGPAQCDSSRCLDDPITKFTL